MLTVEEKESRLVICKLENVYRVTRDHDGLLESLKFDVLKMVSEEIEIEQSKIH